MTVDGDGNVLSVAVTEPRFAPAEVDLLLASRRREREPRGSHGLPLAETMDPANQFAYRVPDPDLDFATLAINRAKDRWKKQEPDADMSALMFRVERRD